MGSPPSWEVTSARTPQSVSHLPHRVDLGHGAASPCHIWQSGAVSLAGRPTLQFRAALQRHISLIAARAVIKGDDGALGVTLDGVGLGRALAAVGWGTTVACGQWAFGRIESAKVGGYVGPVLANNRSNMPVRSGGDRGTAWALRSMDAHRRHGLGQPKIVVSSVQS